MRDGDGWGIQKEWDLGIGRWARRPCVDGSRGRSNALTQLALSLGLEEILFQTTRLLV
jgi:hypothetical protein